MKTPLLIIVGLLVLASLFFVLKPKSEISSPGPTNTPVIETQVPTPTPDPNIFEIEIKENKIVTGPKTIQTKKGSEITIKITTDKADELHMHGYDKLIKLIPGTAVSTTFVTNLTGRFTFELHNAEVELGALEVLP